MTCFYRSWLKCRIATVLALALALFLGGAGRAAALTPLDPSTPASFFNTLADNFLRDLAASHPGMYTPGLCITNIPVYPTNCYTPAVQRLLQLAANIYDASTNRAFLSSPTNYYPSVFRPVFFNTGTNIFIAGYEEVGIITNVSTTPYFAPPLALPDDLALVPTGLSHTNIFGFPWIFGAKKGLPNFNEFAYNSVSQITRRLEVDKLAPGTPRSGWRTNQMYQIGVSNVIGASAWNSYLSPYPRALQIIVANDLRMSLIVTNDGNTTPVFTTNLPTPFILGTNYTIPAGGWSGFSNTVIPQVIALSFQPWQSNVVFIPDAAYKISAPGLYHTNFGYEPLTSASLPHVIVSITNRLRFLLLDNTDLNETRLLDYVQFKVNSTRDLSSELRLSDPLGVWGTNLTSHGLLIGVVTQLDIATGAIGISQSQWNSAQLPADVQSMQTAIAGFDNWLNVTPAPSSNLVMQVPFTPTAKYTQNWLWQANDPLVHYFLSDLNTSQQAPAIQAVPLNLSITNPLPSLTSVVPRYHPWNFYANGNTDPGILNPVFKDPLVTRSDYWNFPAGQPLAASWLGQVHRGTPWQTVYLKSGGIADTNGWMTWTGNTNPADSLVTMPTNDWHLAALLAWLLNTNNLTTLLPVNQMKTGTWSATFTNGITVLTNNAGVYGELDSVVMNSGSPQLATILNGINTVRASQPGGYFRDVGTVFATPELSLNSPWLYQSGNPYITDTAYEAIPSQILGSLFVDSIGSVLPVNGALQLQFTGYDGHNYTVQGSTNLVDWTDLGTSSPSNGVFSITDPGAVGMSQRYYRSKLIQ